MLRKTFSLSKQFIVRIFGFSHVVLGSEARFCNKTDSDRFKCPGLTEGAVFGNVLPPSGGSSGSPEIFRLPDFQWFSR